MFPKPPRPEPPRRAIATQVVQQRTTVQPVTSVLIVEKPPSAPTGAGTPPAGPADQPAD
jgi:hypothetical protein